MSAILYENQFISLAEFKIRCKLAAFKKGAPMQAHVPNKYIPLLNESQMFSPAFKTTYQNLVDMADKAELTEKKIGIKNFHSMVGLGTFASADIAKGEFIVYAGKILSRAADNFPEVDSTYLLSCTDGDSPWAIYVDAREEGNIARFTMHCPDKANLKHYNMSETIKKNIATANLEFQVWWAINTQTNGLYILPIQKVLEKIPAGTFLGIDYGEDYWKNYLGGIEPAFINKNNGLMIEKYDWSLQITHIQLNEQYGLALKLQSAYLPEVKFIKEAEIAPKFRELLKELQGKPRLPNFAVSISSFHFPAEPWYQVGKDHYNKAIIYLKEQTLSAYSIAISCLKKAIDDLPFCAQYHLALSYTYFLLGNKEETIRFFKNFMFLKHYIEDTQIIDNIAALGTNKVLRLSANPEDVFNHYFQMIDEIASYVNSKDELVHENDKSNYIENHSADVLIHKDESSVNLSSSFFSTASITAVNLPINSNFFIKLNTSYYFSFILRAEVDRKGLPFFAQSATINELFQKTLAEIEQQRRRDLPKPYTLNCLPLHLEKRQFGSEHSYDAGQSDYNKAMRFLKRQTKKGYQKAVEYLEKALEEFPLCGKYYLALSYAYFLQANKNKCAEALKNTFYLDHYISDTSIDRVENLKKPSLIKVNPEELFIHYKAMIKTLFNYANSSEMTQSKSTQVSTKATSFFKAAYTPTFDNNNDFIQQNGV